MSLGEALQIFLWCVQTVKTPTVAIVAGAAAYLNDREFSA